VLVRRWHKIHVVFYPDIPTELVHYFSDGNCTKYNLSIYVMVHYFCVYVGVNCTQRLRSRLTETRSFLMQIRYIHQGHDGVRHWATYLMLKYSCVHGERISSSGKGFPRKSPYRFHPLFSTGHLSVIHCRMAANYWFCEQSTPVHLELQSHRIWDWVSLRFIPWCNGSLGWYAGTIAWSSVDIYRWVTDYLCYTT